VLTADLAARAAAEETTVKRIAADINGGTVYPDLTAVSIQRGIITEAVAGGGAAGGSGARGKGRRSDILEARGKKTAAGGGGTISGAKGKAHPVGEIVTHVRNGGHIPDLIKSALVKSRHYLVPGQTRANPTAPPKKSSRGGSRGTGGSGAQGGQGRRSLDTLDPRDLDYDLVPRAEPKITLKKFKGLINAMKRDPNAKKQVLAALNSDATVREMAEELIDEYGDSSLHGRDALPDVTIEGMEALVDAMKETKSARIAVLAAFNKSENIQKVTNQLAKTLVKPEDLKRRAELAALLEARAVYLEARDAEAEFEADLDGYLY
jgi:hypothetical protein